MEVSYNPDNPYNPYNSANLPPIYSEQTHVDSEPDLHTLTTVIMETSRATDSPRNPNQDIVPPPVLVNGVLLCSVFDGMRGIGVGSDASMLAAESQRNFFIESLLGDKDYMDITDILRFSVEKANQMAYAAGQTRSPLFPDMGTTATSIAVWEEPTGKVRAAVAQVGRSCVYRFSKKDQLVKPVTYDQSPLSELIYRGTLTREQAKNRGDLHNVLDQYIGRQPTVAVQISEGLTLEVGDMLFICSHGLLDVVNDETIQRLCERYKNPVDLSNHLLEEAKKSNEWRDDSSVVVAVRGKNVENASLFPEKKSPPPDQKPVREVVQLLEDNPTASAITAYLKATYPDFVPFTIYDDTSNGRLLRNIFRYAVESHEIVPDIPTFIQTIPEEIPPEYHVLPQFQIVPRPEGTSYAAPPYVYVPSGETGVLGTYKSPNILAKPSPSDKNSIVVTGGVVQFDYPGFSVAGVSGRGKERASKPNQDCAFLPLPEFLAVLPPGQFMWFVSDGLGGHSDGKLSAMEVPNILANTYARIMKNRNGQRPSDYEIVYALLQSVKEAHAGMRLINESRSTPKSFFNSLTTLSGGIIQGDKAYILNFGDTRTYVVRGDKIIRATNDDSELQILVNQGLVTPQRMPNNPEGNILSGFIGDHRKNSDPIHPSVTIIHGLKSGDRLFTLTDGIHTKIVGDPDSPTFGDQEKAGTSGDQIMGNIVRTTPTILGAALNLYTLAWNGFPRQGINGGDDNMTAVVVKIQ